MYSYYNDNNYYCIPVKLLPLKYEKIRINRQLLLEKLFGIWFCYIILCMKLILIFTIFSILHLFEYFLKSMEQLIPFSLIYSVLWLKIKKNGNKKVWSNNQFKIFIDQKIIKRVVSCVSGFSYSFSKVKTKCTQKHILATISFCLHFHLKP